MTTTAADPEAPVGGSAAAKAAGSAAASETDANAARAAGKSDLVAAVGLVKKIAAGNASTSDATRVSHVLARYQEQPQLLDPHLQSLVVPLMATICALARDPTADLHRVAGVCRILQIVTTVRGHKTVGNFVPHAPADLVPAVGLLLRLERSAGPGGTLPQHDIGAAPGAPPGAGGIEEVVTVWESLRVVMMWLGVLVLIPFDLSTVDEGDKADGTASASAAGLDGDANATNDGCAFSGPYPGVVRSILVAGTRYLADPGGIRDTAAVMLGRLLVRPDMARALDDFLSWAEAELMVDPNDDPTGDARRRQLFLVPGVAAALASLFKAGVRSTLLPLAARLWPLALLLAERANESNNVLARKLSLKFTQRVSLTLLGADGARLLAGDKEVVIAAEVEESIQLLLGSLRDHDTVCRWSAAKGVGRICARLPAELTADVAAECLAGLDDAEDDATWHGSCLALAELARRRLLDADLLESAAPVVARAFAYDVRRGPHSVGVHVRDAAAYVVWALARDNDGPEILRAIKVIAPAMIVTACYDREVMCRRAASAAFQECVGHLGGTLPHGIEILTAADFFTLSVRSHAYIEVAPFVAQFPSYGKPLALHLVNVKLQHWDRGLRTLAAVGLASLASRLGDLLATVAVDALVPRATDPVLEVRHGAALGLAELLPALAASGVVLSPERQAAVAELIPAIEKARLYRGKGGEIMRSAVCRLAEGMARVGHPLDQPTRKRTLASLDER